ncbi:MAG: FecR domain-containing protein [Deltaproteobacteria bacterium]|nr:FecR domain-containing protein [Deltaproteobacteria bacterium]
MTALKKRSLYYVVSALTSIFLLVSAFAYSSTESLLPQGLIIEDIFKPGYGSSVGRILVVQGNVVIIHKDMPRGYRAKKDLPLFKRDTIVTQEKGRIRFEMNDGSMLTMGSSTKLVIDRSVYDAKKKSRSSFFRLALGKARFWAKKLVDLRYSKFKVRTPTTVVGVRGSDFIIKTTLKLTEVTALDKTVLEAVSRAFPEAKPMVVNDFERTFIKEGALPTDVEIVKPEEIEEMKKEFIVTPDVVEPEEKLKAVKQKEPVKPVEKILVPEEDLVMPEDPGALEDLIGVIVSDIVEKEEISSQEEGIVEQVSEIEESVAEEGIIEELPEFPETP